MISERKNCIFIHIPKCGGTSIENMIWNKEEKTEKNLFMGFVGKMHNKYQTGGLQHLLGKQIKQEVGPLFFNQAYKFTMVRNPWDRIISQFTYIKKRKDLMEYINMKSSCDLITYLSLIKKVKHVQWEHQYKFFLDDSGNSLVDKIYRFENYVTEVQKLMKKLNIDYVDILHSKKGDRGSYKDYYNQEAKEIVQDMYSKDIKILGYKY